MKWVPDFFFLGTNVHWYSAPSIPCRCYLKLGEWQQSLEETSQHTIEDSLVYFSKATEHDRDWYKVGGHFLPFHFNFHSGLIVNQSFFSL